MRVPSISTYVNATYRLGNLTSDLESANEVVSTQKQINEISDDPLGLSQVLSLQNTLGYLEQIEQNVSMGRSWIQSIEGALDSVNDLMLDIKTDVARLANASMSADERNDAIALVEHGIEQIVALGNTQINGNYIFGGTDTDKIPLEYDKDLEKVSYKGNDIPFEVRTDKNLGVEVGRDGKKTFWDQEIQINSTNNTVVFTEDNGHGSSSQKVLTAVIEDGLYSKEDLTTVLKNALNDVSASEGYGVVYKVDYNEDDQQYSIREDGTYSGFINTEFLWESGGEPFISNLASSSSINPDDINIDINNSSALSIDTPIPHGTEPFRLTWQGDNTWSVENNPGYTILPFDIPGDRDSISIDFNESGTPDITIQLDKPVTEKGQFIEFDIVSAKGDSSVGHEIGFKWDDSIQAPPVSDVQAKYVNELIIEDGLNDEIVFEEVNSAGVGTTLSVDLNSIGVDIEYADMDDLAQIIEEEMGAASVNGVVYAVTYDPTESRFNIREDGSSLNELNILWSNSPETAETLGFYPFDDLITYPAGNVIPDVPITIDDTNNKIDFEEISIDGIYSEEISISIPEGDYAGPVDVATEIETALRDASPNGVDYVVDYSAGSFMVKGSDSSIKSFTLLWQTGMNREEGAGAILGFSGDDTVTFSESDEAVVNITIDSSNNKIDFRELISGDIGKAVGSLTASIREKTYTSHDELASEVEIALEAESRLNGNEINYSVVWDDYTQKFTIKENGSELEQLDLMWQTGDNAPVSEGGTGQSIGNLLGFTANDDVHKTLTSVDKVEWGIFDTLIDLKTYLSDNDSDGIERTIGRLEQNFDLMTSRIADAGMKFSRLEIRDTINSHVGLSLIERKSRIEDADVVESIMNLKNIENAYQAALSSTSKVLNMSLLDYL